MVIKSPSSLRAPSYQNTDIHTRAPCYTHSKTTQTKSHFDKSHQPKHWLYSPRSLSLLQMHSNSFFFPFSLALTCPVVSRLCVRPIVAWTTVGASASKRRRRSRMENMSRIRKQQKILHMSALTAAEKTVCLDEWLSKYNFCQFKDLLNTIGNVNSLILVNKRQKRWNAKCHHFSLIKEHTQTHTHMGTACVLIGFSGQAVKLFLSLRSRQAGDDGWWRVRERPRPVLGHHMLHHMGKESALAPLWMGFFFGCYIDLTLEDVDDFILCLQS